MSLEERNLLAACLDVLGPELPSAFQDCGFCEVGPGHGLFETLCRDHHVEPEEMTTLLRPGKQRPLRDIVLELTSLLIDTMRKEAA
jgi:hypothetical protein